VITPGKGTVAVCTVSNSVATAGRAFSLQLVSASHRNYFRLWQNPPMISAVDWRLSDRQTGKAAGASTIYREKVGGVRADRPSHLHSGERCWDVITPGKGSFSI
jgi:hypothetical protein